MRVRGGKEHIKTAGAAKSDPSLEEKGRAGLSGWEKAIGIRGEG